LNDFRGGGGGKYNSNFLFHLATTSIKMFLYLSYMKHGCQMNCKPGVLLNISCVVKCFLVTVSPTEEDLNVSSITTIYYSKSENLCGFKTVDT